MKKMDPVLKYLLTEKLKESDAYLKWLRENGAPYPFKKSKVIKKSK